MRRGDAHGCDAEAPGTIPERSPGALGERGPYGGQSHLLVITYETNDEATFAAQLNHAKQLIDSIRMPVEAEP